MKNYENIWKYVKIWNYFEKCQGVKSSTFLWRNWLSSTVFNHLTHKTWEVWLMQRTHVVFNCIQHTEVESLQTAPSSPATKRDEGIAKWKCLPATENFRLHQISTPPDLPRNDVQRRETTFSAGSNNSKRVGQIDKQARLQISIRRYVGQRMTISRK